MAEAILCLLCGKRRAKRSCPAVNGQICSICCGEQRETILFCPLSCVYLEEAHKREKTLEIPVEEIANKDVEVTEEFLLQHEEAVGSCIISVLKAAHQIQGVVDEDVLQALAAMVQTERTAQSGLLYETQADNAVALAVQQGLTEAMKDYERERESQGLKKLATDRAMFKILVFLYRVGQQNQNGKPKGRMFIGLLQSMAPLHESPEPPRSIIL